jgi:hypothetical protein
MTPTDYEIAANVAFVLILFAALVFIFRRHL